LIYKKLKETKSLPDQQQQFVELSYSSLQLLQVPPVQHFHLLLLEQVVNTSKGKKIKAW